MLQFALYCNAFCWMWTYLDIVLYCTSCMISRRNTSWSILLASILNYLSKFQLILEYRIYIVSIIEWSYHLYIMPCKCPQNTPKFICQTIRVYSITNKIQYRLCSGSYFYNSKPMILRTWYTVIRNIIALRYYFQKFVW